VYLISQSVELVLTHAHTPTHIRVDTVKVIDATLRGGYARYINHSCTPNCESKIVDGAPPHEHLKRVLIISQRNINASEELTYDYNFPLEMNLDLRIPCNCGSKQCRGFMNWDIPEKSYRHYAKISKAARRGRT
jgi:histone-lysine N-methyltransferase SETD1